MLEFTVMQMRKANREKGYCSSKYSVHFGLYFRDSSDPVLFSVFIFENMMKHCLSCLVFPSMLVISILFLNLYQYLSSHHYHQMRLRKPRGRRPNQEGTEWKLTKASDGAPDKLLLRPSLMFFCCCCFFSLFTY